MPNGLRLYNLNKAERTGEAIPLDSDGKFADVVFDQLGLTHDRLSRSLFATDMDGTMFKSVPSEHITGDIGVLVFLDKVQDPTFWDFTPRQFEKLLLPKKYREFAEANIENQVCQIFLNLVEDLVQLYRLKKVAMARKLGEYSDKGPDIELIVKEFALKMIMFDEVTKQVEEIMMKKGISNEILMRTRFFSGKKVKDVRDRTRALFERSKLKNVAPIRLSISPQLNYNRRVEDAPDRIIKPVARINNHIRDLIVRLSSEYQAHGLVVTTNVLAIAQAAIYETEYNYYIDEIEGSKLVRSEDDGVLGARFDGPAVFGAKKSEIACNSASREKRTLLCAMGDTVHGDGEMGLSAIQNGGIFVVTGNDMESILRAFTPFLREAQSARGIPNVLDRTWAVTYS